MRWTPLLFLLLISIAAEPVCAAQVVEASEGRSVPVRVSRSDLTRLVMADGGRIVRVWTRASQVTLRADPESGQVFLRPAAATKAFTLFLRDAEGATYSLLALPADVPGDTVFIRPSGASVGRATSFGAMAEPYVARLGRWARVLARGGVPREAQVEELDELVPLLVPSWEARALRLRLRVRSGSLVGERYLLSNLGETELRVEEREFAVLGRVLAVAVDRHALAPGESGAVFLLRRAE